MNQVDALRAIPGRVIRLASIDPASDLAIDRSLAEQQLAENRHTLERLQYRLWAERTRSILVVLQGMDTSGKDGVVRHVIRGMNPEGCRVVSFKKPSEVENGHDFLWRVHHECPARGEVVVFNRSHYEDVLVVRVHGLVPPSVWKARFDAINHFEENLTREGTIIIKIFLHISKGEQKKRLIARINDPEKNWKFNPGDIAERKRWTSYQRAHEDVIARCGTPVAPWFVVPADKKWFRDWAVSEILIESLCRLDPRPPKGNFRVQDFEF